MEVMKTLKDFEDNIIQRMSVLRKEIKHMQGKNAAFATKSQYRLKQLKAVYSEIKYFKNLGGELL